MAAPESSTPVIDLTLEDSDEDEELRPNFSNSHTICKRELTVAHDGLTTPGPFNFKAGSGNQSINGANSIVQSPRDVHNLKPAPPRTGASLPCTLQPKLTTTSEGPARTSQTPIFPVHRMQQSLPFPALKRRKTGGATLLEPHARRSSQAHSYAPKSHARGSLSMQVPSPQVTGTQHGSNSRHADERWTADPRMHKAIKEQVLEHIRTSVNRYHYLAKVDRDEIGRRAAKKLVAEPGFEADFEANGLRFSNQFEMRLASKAQDFVDKAAADFLTVEPPAPNSMGLIRGESPKTAHFKVSSSSSSRSSSEDIGNFRHYSSSPPTSVSNDNGDHEDSKTFLRMSIEVENIPATLSSTLNLREVEEIGLPTEFKKVSSTPIQQPLFARHTQAIQPHLSGLSLTMKARATALSEVQLLRYSGLDPALRRPYLSLQTRQDVSRGLEYSKFSTNDCTTLETTVLHLDFCTEEIIALLDHVTAILGHRKLLNSDPAGRVIALMRGRREYIPLICDAIIAAKSVFSIGWKLLKRRNIEDVRAFLEDATAGHVSGVAQLMRLRTIPGTSPRLSLSAVLREREMSGTSCFRVGQGKLSYSHELYNYQEDALNLEDEWTDCSGDITTISWVNPTTFIYGATAHSDKHNMQYNKPGNLGIGSLSTKTIQSIADHRILRPLIDSNENVENSLESMRQTQDPWLYTSVVSTAHSDISKLTFTASFDHTVKIWSVAKNSPAMNLQGSWKHDGKVNFVVASANSKSVATASDVSWNAVRVYEIDELDISSSRFDCYTSDREQTEEGRKRDGWAYFPATIAWGISPTVAKLLLVGYSPRSINAQENDIPEEKWHTGELALWNVEDGSRVLITSTSTQNVFEVLWHPTQPIFLAATSPSKSFERDDIMTQVRLFAQNDTGGFGVIKTLDCRASDINELTIMPNSRVEMYVTASCTDGNTYVWDTAQGDDPIHVLGHGESLDNPHHDVPREDADTGVKFASWGQTPSRLYTGSSDGKIKAWDVTAPKGQAFVRTVVSVSGGISAGAFSKDYSKLVVGDATGKVHLLAVDDGVENPKAPPTAQFNPLLGRRVPNVITPHHEAQQKSCLPDNEQPARDASQAFLKNDQISIHPNRKIGACQGPKYFETKLYRADAHQDKDPTKPLLSNWQAQQYEAHQASTTLTLPRLPGVNHSSLEKYHLANQLLDLDFSDTEWATLRLEHGIDHDFKPNDEFDFDYIPRSKLFNRTNRAAQIIKQ